MTMPVRKFLCAGLLAGCVATGSGAATLVWADHRHHSSDPGADVAGCASFATVDFAVREARRPGADQPRGPDVAERPPLDFIGLADALQNTRRELSPALDRAVVAYLYALANLGASINHRETTDAIQTFDDLTKFSAETVAQICHDRGIATTPGETEPENSRADNAPVHSPAASYPEDQGHDATTAPDQ